MNGPLRRRGSERGFTLVELLVVMSILAVLAAVVIPTVTGVNTVARNTAQPADLKEVDTAVTRFNSDGSSWPTKASLTGASPSWSAGARPGTVFTGTGTTADPHIFTQNTIAGLKTDTSATVDGTTKTFSPDYSSKPKHISDTITLAANASTTVNLARAGTTYSVKLWNTTGAELSFDAWGVDANGQVWVFIDKDRY